MMFSAIYKNKKVLNFEVTHPSTHVDIVVNADKAFIFKDVKMWNKRIDKKTVYHCCSGNYTSDRNIYEAPRRKTELNCIYKRGSNRGTCEAIITDMSFTHFTVQIDGLVSVGDLPSVVISFPDSYILKGALKLSCEVTEVIGEAHNINKQKLVRCRLLHESQPYRDFVASLGKNY
jgi:hypothetical protein